MMTNSQRFLSICLLALTTTLASATSFAGKKTAVLVLGYHGSPFAVAMANQVRAAQKFYSAQGFETVVIGDYAQKNPPTRETLMQVLGGLTNVSDLRIDFNSHGVLAKSTDTDRYPAIPMGPRRRAVLPAEQNIEKISEIGFVSLNLSQIGTDLIADYFHEETSDFEAQDLSIGVGDLKDALALFRKNNPESDAVVALLSGHSGAVAEQLAFEPRTIVLASAPTTERSRFEYNSDTNEFTRNAFRSYYETLTSDGSKSVLEAWNQAAVQGSPGSVLAYQSARSPQYQLVTEWCTRTGMGEQLADSTNPVELISSVESEMNRISAQFQSFRSSPKFDAEMTTAKACLAERSQNFKEAEALNKAVTPLFQSLLKSMIPTLIAKLNSADLSLQTKIRQAQIQILNSALAIAAKGVAAARLSEVAREKQRMEQAGWDEISDLFVEKLTQMKRACEVEPQGARCLMSFQPAMVLWKVVITDNAVTCQDFGTKKEKVDCLLKASPTQQWAAVAANVRPLPARQRARSCERLGGVAFDRGQKALNLDRECLAAFQKKAEVKEWDRLREIIRMGSKRVAGQ